MPEDLEGQLAYPLNVGKHEWSIVTQTFVDGPYDRVEYTTDQPAYLKETLELGVRINGRDRSYVVVYRYTPPYVIVPGVSHA